MDDGTRPARTDSVRVTRLDIGDEPDAWERAGFSVAHASCWLGSTELALRGEGGDRRILAWQLTGIDADGLDHANGACTLDGLPTVVGVESTPPEPMVSHPNGAASIDHVVVLSPDHDRTVEAFEAVGVARRRTRSTDTYGTPMLQSFFRAGPTIIELVAPPSPLGDGPSGFFGLAITVADLDATASLLGEHLGRVKDAVQPGRRITTLRHKDLGMSVAIAFMGPEPDAT